MFSPCARRCWALGPVVAEVEGIVTRINLDAGDAVARGDLRVLLDPAGLSYGSFRTQASSRQVVVSTT